MGARAGQRRMPLGEYAKAVRIEREMKDALRSWLNCESAENGRKLYIAGCAYFGIKPDERLPLADRE